MGHLDKQNVKRLQEMSTGMTKLINAHPCTVCILGRMKEKPNNKSFPRGEYPLEYFHTDIASPFPVVRYNGCRYWVTFLNDATQLSTIIPITHMSEMFNELQKFIAKYKQPERRCHRIRLDDRGENRDSKFREWSAQRGISIEVTTTDQHEQNGAAESLNRVIMDKLHPTLLSANLDKKWWPEILLTVNYLRNLSSSSVIRKTPYEAWYGEKPDLSHLRIIGCTAYTKKVESKRRKLADEKAFPCKLLGYNDDRIYRLLTYDNRIIRSTNVEFVEKNPFQHTHSDHFSAPRPGPSRADGTLDPHGAVSRANQPKESECSHSSVQRGEISREQPDDYLLKLELPVTTTPSRIEPSNSEHAHMPELTTNEIRVSTRVTKSQVPRRFMLVASLAKNSKATSEAYKPANYKEAIEDSVQENWLAAMQEEFQSLLENQTWTLVPAPAHRKVLRGKWTFKLKRGAKGEVTRYKARWVVRGFEQEEGLDYHETFATVVKPMSYKALFEIASALDLEIEQLDVQTAFLYRAIDEKIFVEQPIGQKDGSSRVCLLNKALYGLKNRPRASGSLPSQRFSKNSGSLH